MIKYFKKLLEKRNLDPRSWIPLSLSQTGGQVVREPSGLSQIRRGLGLYRDLLLNSRLHAYQGDKRIEDDDICRLMEKPNRWMTKSEFYTQLVQDYFINGDFYAHIFEDRGRVTALGPYPSETVHVYPRGKTIDPSDPVQIQTQGFYFQTSFKDSNGNAKTSQLPEDSIFHLKNLWGGRIDTLNGTGLWEAYGSVCDFAVDILDTSQKYSETGLIPPSIIKGVDEMPPEQREDLRKELQNFFSAKSQFLTLSANETLDPLTVQNPSTMLMNLNSIASCHIARLLNLPVALVDREDSGSDTSGLGLKEAHRFWVKTGGRAFLRLVAEKLSELSENRLEFAWRSTQFADMRESQALVPLVQEKIIELDKAKEFLED